MVNEVIVAGDVEAGLVAYFAALLTIKVGTRVPNPRPAEFLRLQRTGGVMSSLVTDAAQVTFDYWAGTEPLAASGAQLTRARCLALPGGTVGGLLVTRVEEVSGPQNLPDPQSDSPRYSFTLLVHTRAM